MVKNSNTLSVNGLNMALGEFELQDVSFGVQSGEYFILLGPTGCGKTMLAETVCGLNVPNAGKIHIGDRDVTVTDPAKRRIGYVPQDYALLPFKTVEENIAFGLKARNLNKAEAKRRVEEVTDMLDIDHLRRRHPVHLSGGERQRVALGRALAIKPDIMVLDEPLSALDENTCRELMRRLKDIHEQTKATIIHICHRLEEAITLGDMIMVMRGGRVEQAAPADEIFKRPRNLFIARFLQLTNVSEGVVKSESGEKIFYLNNTPVAATDLPEGAAYCVIPLQDTLLSEDEPEAGEGEVVVEAVLEENNTTPNSPGLCFKGAVNVKIPGVFSEQQWYSGKSVFLKFPASDIYLFSE